MSSASGPLTSPTTIRVGRIRRAWRTSSRMPIFPSPSTFAARASSATQSEGAPPGGARRSPRSSRPARLAGCCFRARSGGGLAGGGSARDEHDSARPPPRGRTWRARPSRCRAVPGRRGFRHHPVAADREAWPAGKRRKQGVQPGAVGKAHVDGGRGVVDPPSCPRDDPGKQRADFLVGGEAGRTLLPRLRPGRRTPGGRRSTRPPRPHSSSSSGCRGPRRNRWLNKS